MLLLTSILAVHKKISIQFVHVTLNKYFLM